MALALCFLVIHALHALCTADMPIPFMVRSLQLVEVRPYAEEEEETNIGNYSIAGTRGQWPAPEDTSLSYLMKQVQ